MKPGCKFDKGLTLCWYCKHAVPDLESCGCEWSILGEPMPGWEAQEEGESYMVTACPKFCDDRRYPYGQV